MLDTSDRQVFIAGNDPAMGTYAFKTTITDQKSIPLLFDKERRQLLLTNLGPGVIYLGITAEVRPDFYAARLLPKGVLYISDYGGMIAAICDVGQTSNLSVASVK